MTTLMVPPLEERPWPTLGPQVCDWMEAFLIHGPGDVRGQAATIDDETRALLYRAYEIFPRDHPQAGRRRFKRAAWSLRKGTAKTEKAAWVAAAESHPEAPVRCDGWKRQGRGWVPVGRPVRDPYIPMVAYTEEQTEELAFGALYVILSEGPLADDYDVGLDRILVLSERGREAGKIVPLAAAPDSRDGARTTWQHFDETHRFTLPRLREAHQTMQANLPKRKLADAWSLETTTMFTPGEQSVAEGTMTYAEEVAAGKVKDSRLFFFHRQASDTHDLTTEDGVRAAVIEASGPDVLEWSDIDGIVELWRDPQTDRSYFERVWTNRKVQSAAQAFDVVRWRALADRREIPRGELVVLSFDGARFRDSTGLMATHVASGFQQVVAVWERPDNVGEAWEIDDVEVDAAVDAAFDRWNVWRLYADPPYWDSTINGWAGRYGEKRVVKWWTNRLKAMAYACRSYEVAIRTGQVVNDGNEIFERHIANARRHEVQLVDDEGRKLWVIRKERKDSELHIDLAVCGVIGWEGRGDALAAGALEHQAHAPATAPSAPAADPRENLYRPRERLNI